MSEVLQVRGLKRNFQQGGVTIHVLRGVDLDVDKGEIVALLGPSGSGKSTLLQAVGLLEGGFEGSIRINGEEAAQLDNDGRTRLRRDVLGFVYQFHHLLPDFNASENGDHAAAHPGRRTGRGAERAASLLSSLGLEHRLTPIAPKPALGRRAAARGRCPGAAIVRRWCSRTSDGQSGRGNRRCGVRRILGARPRRGSAALVATHNERIAAKMDRVLRLHEGVLE
jgi:lipoprotein-releasing system ATP-binding protein